MTSPLLTVDGISRRFGGIRAVDDASFAVQEGSITGLIGPNGAGKTTAFNLISGFLRVHGGTISFDGQRIEKQQSHAIARAGLVRTFQIPRVLTRMSVLENMMLAAPHQPGEFLGARCLPPAACAAGKARSASRLRKCWTWCGSLGWPMTTPGRCRVASASCLSSAAR